MRKLTEKARTAIRRSFYSKIATDIGARDQAKIYADHACALLELPPEDTAGWWEIEEDRGCAGDRCAGCSTCEPEPESEE